MKQINIVGCGRAGRTLARLWAQAGVFEIQDMLDAAAENAAQAVAFVGAGRVAAALDAMRPAAVWLIATTDAQIVPAGAQLAGSGALRAGDIVFHLSGALPSRELKLALGGAAPVGGVHPLKSFADPALASASFRGTYCGAEGDAAALAVLKPAFECIGAEVFEIDPDGKTVYHAASVMVCNDLTALLEAGLRCYEHAGLERAMAFKVMEPLVREALDHVFRLGTAQALTGPIARGDHPVVARQLAALAEWHPRIGEIYRQLGTIALELARAQGKASAENLDAVARALAAAPAGKS